MDELTFTVSSYITFCEEIVIPRKTITLYPNNKAWVKNSLKNTLNQKRLVFHQVDIHQQTAAHKLVKREIKLAKMQFKDKIEG